MSPETVYTKGRLQSDSVPIRALKLVAGRNPHPFGYRRAES